MRILIISNLFPPDILGGYEILCEQVCDLLHRRGHQVTVLTTGDAYEDAHSYPVQRKLALYLPFPQLARMARLRRVIASRRNYRITRQVIESVRPEVIFIWSQLRLTTGSAKAAEDSGCIVAYTMNDEHLAGYVTKQLGLFGAIKHIVDERILKIGIGRLQLRNSTCISQSVKSRLLQRGIFMPSSKVIFQGIPLEKFSCKKDLGSIGAAPKILYVGQLHRYKGVHTVIEAVDRLHREGQAIELTICGQGATGYTRQLTEQASTTEAPITFLGKVPHDALPEIYRSHDVFVFPSTWAEPFGLTHLEAMASGTPVVSTAEGGHGEFLRHDVNAYIFKPGSALQLADRLRALIHHPACAKRIALTARRQVEQEFTLEAYGDRLEEWLRSLI